MPRDAPSPEPTRRDFVLVGAAAFAGMGGLLALWPLVSSMNPTADTQALPTLDVDLQQIAPGQSITVAWQGRPIVVRHRTAAEIAAARAIVAGDLRDPLARNDALPPQSLARDENRTVEGHPEWLLVVGICTHDGCVLAAAPRVTLEPGEGFACLCCNTRFDVSGRVRSGPARANLGVPRYEFLSPTRIRLH